MNKIYKFRINISLVYLIQGHFVICNFSNLPQLGKCSWSLNWWLGSKHPQTQDLNSHIWVIPNSTLRSRTHGPQSSYKIQQLVITDIRVHKWTFQGKFEWKIMITCLLLKFQFYLNKLWLHFPSFHKHPNASPNCDPSSFSVNNPRMVQIQLFGDYVDVCDSFLDIFKQTLHE